jgi:DNA-3-methyladenine glycosylase
MAHLNPEFFTRDPVVCARELIGCEFVWKGCSGKIVETEAYRSAGDEACHTFLKPSVRDFVAHSKAGDAYVYLNYGVHWLFNIVVKGAEHEGFVLLRALDPITGIEKMRERRGGISDKLLTAGPGRLTQAMGIGREGHGTSFLQTKECAIFRGTVIPVIAGSRIGISKAKDLPWRFGDPSSKCLSKRF